jgi:hypothetical protein
MKGIIIALAMSLLASGSALASEESDLIALFKQWMSSEAGTVAACADDASVVDDVAPFEWHGPAACSRWQKDYDAYVQKEGITAASGALGKPLQLMIAGDRAYAVLPTTFAFTQKGKRVRITATSTFALRKTPAGWRITAWAWATQTIR